MSYEYNNPTPPPATDPAPDKKPWYKRTWVYIVAGVVAFLLVLGTVGGPSQSEVDDAKADAAAAQAEAKEAEERAEDLEAQVEDLENQEPEVVTETPKECIVALDKAEALVQGPVVDQSEDFAWVLGGLIPRIIDAVSANDGAAADQILGEMEDLTARTEARTGEVGRLVNQYNKAAEVCRG